MAKDAYSRKDPKAPEDTKERITHIAPLILAGGKSSRMGTNKSFVLLNGKPMIEIIVEKLAGIFQQPPLLITNSPEDYAYLGLCMASDLIKDKGPLGGIHTGLLHSDFQYSFIFGCDMPLLCTCLIRHMVGQLAGEDIVLPRQGQAIEPLHAIYAKTCIPHIEEKLSQGQFQIRSFFSDVNVRYIERQEIEACGYCEGCFMNVNTKEDLQHAEQIWRQKQCRNM